MLALVAERWQELTLRASQVLGRELRITSRLGGGQHAVTVAAEAADGTELVVRAFPAGDDAVEREIRVLRCVTPLGGRVPRLVAHDCGGSMPLIITTRLRGGHPSPGLPAGVIAIEMARALARIHQLDGDGLPTPPLDPPGGSRDAPVVAQWAWSRLDRSEFDRTEYVLTHSDFWCGNAVWDGSTLTGVVDWAGAHRAPRGVDVAWCRLDLVLLGEVAAADVFLDEYQRSARVVARDHHDWDLFAAARAEGIVETWASNYLDIGRTELVPQELRRRFDLWTGSLPN